MINIFRVLQKRERTGRSNDLQEWLDKKFEDNIRQDKQLSQKISLDSGIFVLGWCNDFVAVLDNENRLSLFDISTQQKLWSISVVRQYHYPDAGLIIDNSGLILYITKEFSSLPKSHVQIFFNGMKLGEFIVKDDCFISSSMRIVNNRIFGISQSWNVRKLYEWDVQGNLVRSLPMDNLMGADGSNIAVNDNYYIICATSRHQLTHLPVFIFDLRNNKSKTFKLFETEADIEVRSISIINNNLIIGAYHKTKITEFYSKVPINPRINIIDIETGKSCKEYIPTYDYGVISQLKANDRYIIFALYEGHTKGDWFCVDVRNNSINKIKKIYYSSGDPIDITLTGSLLTIYCERERHVINLDTNKVLKKVKYNLHSFYGPSFSKGILLMADTHSSKNALYIENFHNIDIKSNNDVAGNSLRL